MSIGYLPTLGKDLGGIGFYHSKLVHVPQWPAKMLVKEDQDITNVTEPIGDDPDFPSSEELKMHASWNVKSDELSRGAQYYQLYYVEKVPKDVIANKFDIKIKSVDSGIRLYRKKLSYKLNSNNQ